MKRKNKIKRLEARIKAWESYPKNPSGAYTKPGSMNK
jgi:hypothetical protein